MVGINQFYRGVSGVFTEGNDMKKLLLAACLTGFVMPVAAISDTYFCKVKQDSKGNWVPQSLAISYDEKTGKVVVNDEYIMHFHGTPIAGKVVTDNAKRITFSWILPDVKNSAGQRALRFQYRATYLKASHKVVVTSRPSGYEDTFRGAGVCVIKTS